MSLTPAQRTILKTYILADPVLSTKVSGPGTDYGFINNALSISSGVKAWKINVPVNDADDAPDYSTYDALAAGKRDSWNLFLRNSRDFTRAKVRKWITDIWGNATANSNAEAILLAGTENALVAENVIGGTSRTTGTVTALDRNYIGAISIEVVAEILR